MKKIFVALLFLSSAKPLSAQNEDSTYKYWMTAGCWVDRDLSANFNYTFSLGDYFFKAGYFIRGRFLNISSLGENKYLFNSIDFSVGKRFQTEWFQVSLFGGPAYVFGKRKILDDTIEQYDTVGLQSDIQLLFRLANEVGIGIGLYGNANFIKNFAGANINITLGNGK